jgi:rSAM/selenodomain-associated transferase 2
MSQGDLPQLSIVVPTLNEAATLGDLLADLEGVQQTYQVIVVDGGSTDGTPSVARDSGAQVICTAPGRGLQLRAGADAATASLICFLHADARLDAEAVETLSALALRRPAGAFVFRLRIADDRARYRLVELGALLRSRYLRLPYGDQGLIVNRRDYLRAGGYPPQPLMEDVALVRALGKVTEIRVLDADIRVSARRWQRDGVLLRTVRNQVLLLRYLCGARPDRLAGAYRPETPHE